MLALNIFTIPISKIIKLLNWSKPKSIIGILYIYIYKYYIHTYIYIYILSSILELTGGISYKDIFIKEITLNISAAVSRNQELCNTLLLNRGYLHKIFTLFDSFESTIIHYYSIITLANITSYDDFNLVFNNIYMK